MLTIDAHAKINLTLEVLYQRNDDYHEIRSILQTINLHDTLILEHADDLHLKCDIPRLESDNNLALLAANLLKKLSSYKQGAHITLRKKIPISAGMGGGSSDAAAVLVGLNHMWELGLSDSNLMSIAAQLGSDVPFFINGGTALVMGRGEHVQKLPPIMPNWFILLDPTLQITNKTSVLYSKLTPEDYTNGQATKKLEDHIKKGLQLPPSFLCNTFDTVACRTFPGLNSYWVALHRHGFSNVHLAGSGPSIFMPVSDKKQGVQAQLLLNEIQGWNAHVISTWEPLRSEVA